MDRNDISETIHDEHESGHTMTTTLSSITTHQSNTSTSTGHSGSSTIDHSGLGTIDHNSSSTVDHESRDMTILSAGDDRSHNNDDISSISDNQSMTTIHSHNDNDYKGLPLLSDDVTQLELETKIAFDALDLEQEKTEYF